MSARGNHHVGDTQSVQRIDLKMGAMPAIWPPRLLPVGRRRPFSGVWHGQQYPGPGRLPVDGALQPGATRLRLGGSSLITLIRFPCKGLAMPSLASAATSRPPSLFCVCLFLMVKTVKMQNAVHRQDRAA